MSDNHPQKASPGWLMPPEVSIIALSSLLALPISAAAQDAISRGTILPVRLDSSFSLKAKPGKKITASLMQSVPLSNRSRIHAGARVVGHVSSVVLANAGVPTQISFKFDQLAFSGRTTAIRTSLLAIASFVEVEQAQVPEMGADRGTSENSWTTRQVGGDTVYRGGGPVTEGSRIVGEPTYEGVLGRIQPVPGSKCADAIEESTPQALWVFSADTCGTYGLPNIRIQQTGRGDHRGEITLASTDSKLHISSGTAMLLQVIDDRSQNSW